MQEFKSENQVQPEPLLCHSVTEVLAVSISSQLSTHNWSLKKLADVSGIPYETIKKMANGKIANPSLKNMLRIAGAFGCSIDYLIGVREADNPSTNKSREEVYSYLNSL